MLIDLQLDAIFGCTMPPKLQALVDAELNAGRWQDGYDLAVNASGLNQKEGQELLNIVLTRHPGLRIDQDVLLTVNFPNTSPKRLCQGFVAGGR